MMNIRYLAGVEKLRLLAENEEYEHELGESIFYYNDVPLYLINDPVKHGVRECSCEINKDYAKQVLLALKRRRGLKLLSYNLRFRVFCSLLGITYSRQYRLGVFDTSNLTVAYIHH